MHVSNFQVPEDHLAVIKHPLEAQEVVFISAQLGKLVICALTNWKRQREREKERSHEMPRKVEN